MTTADFSILNDEWGVGRLMSRRVYIDVNLSVKASSSSTKVSDVC